MTDLTPNDLSHLSDEEFNALAPQGYHAPVPATALSPGAQAVLDAYWKSPWDPCLQHEDRLAIAAALRAAALYCKRDSVILLSLADELEQ